MANQRIVTQHELCTPCSYDKKIKALDLGKVIPTILGMIFILAAIICFIVMVSFIFFVPIGSNTPLKYMLIIPIILFSCMGAIILLTGAKNAAKSADRKIADLEAKKAEFLKNVASASPVKSRTKPIESEYCPHCGSKINRDEKICEQCGGEL